jgi:hypothetical protein
LSGVVTFLAAADDAVAARANFQAVCVTGGVRLVIAGLPAGTTAAGRATLEAHATSATVVALFCAGDFAVTAEASNARAAGLGTYVPSFDLTSPAAAVDAQAVAVVAFFVAGDVSVAAAVGNTASTFFTRPTRFEAAFVAAITRSRVFIVTLLDALVDAVAALVAGDAGDRTSPAAVELARGVTAVDRRRDEVIVIALFIRVLRAVAAQLTGAADHLAEVRARLAVAVLPLAARITAVSAQGVAIVTLLAEVEYAVAALGAVVPVVADPAGLDRLAVAGAGGRVIVVADFVPFDDVVAALGARLSGGAVPARRDGRAIQAAGCFIAFALIALFCPFQDSAPAPVAYPACCGASPSFVRLDGTAGITAVARNEVAVVTSLVASDTLVAAEVAL